MVFSGNANEELAKQVAKHLNIKLGKGIVGSFSDGETMVELLENVRGKDVFILQSISRPANDNLMEIMVMVDALRRSSAARITAAIPYLGYSRQDRRPRSARVAITAKVVAYATHPIFSGDAINSINNSELDEIVITDTITLEKNAQNTKKIRQVSVAELLAETIRRISHEDSVSSLFLE